MPPGEASLSINDYIQELKEKKCKECMRKKTHVKGYRLA